MIFSFKGYFSRLCSFFQVFGCVSKRIWFFGWVCFEVFFERSGRFRFSLRGCF